MKKKLYSSMLLLFSIFFISNNNLYAQETNSSVEESSVKTVVNVPDENLKKQINLELGHDETADITQADMESLDEIDAQGEGIKDLTGLEYAINLEGLSVGNSKLSDLTPISGLTKLNHLNIVETEVEDLKPISGLTNLEELWLDNNKIENLTPISGLTNLTELWLGSNKIEDLTPISGLTSLTSLDIGYNKVEDISPISNLTNLTGLSMGSNNIKNLEPIRRLNNLSYLEIHDNKIEDLTPISGLKNLKTIMLENNKIYDFSPLKNKNLDIRGGKVQYPYVYLKYNNVMDVPKAYKFIVKEINGKAHEFSVDLSGAKKGSNIFTLDYDAGNGYYGTMTVNLEVGNSSTIQINNPYRVYYLGDGYLSDEEILEYFNIKAYDKDGNDITNQIKVDSSKVNWNKAGIYDITLSILNPDGTVTTKILQIEIKAGENPSKKLIQTGSTGIGFIAMSLIVALGVFFKRNILVK